MLRSSVEALSRAFVAKEVGIAREAAKQTGRTGATIDDVKADTAAARDALNALTTRVGSARFIAATMVGGSESVLTGAREGT